MSEWKKIKLGELYEVHNGLSKGRKFFGSGYPFLTFSNVFNNWFLPSSLDSFVQSTEKEREACSIKKGDVFITRTSETMDELGMSSVALKDYPNATYNGFTKRLRPITNEVIPEYIGYYLRSKKFRNKFMAFSSMTTRASLSNDDLLSMEIEVPDIPIQHRIADILSRYDALIDNYRQQIRLLEEAAQRLYKHWFVDLQFPGHEDTRIVDGVPEGWERRTLGEIATINTMSMPKDDKRQVIDYVDLSSVSKGQILNTVSFETKEAPGRARRLAKDGDVVWGMVRPNNRNYALVLHPSEAMVFSTGFAVITAITVPFTFLYNAITTDSFVGYLNNQTNGAAYPAVKPIHFEKAEIIVPSINILDCFHTKTEPLYRKIENIAIQLHLLSEARDRLLPKLMSGEIAV